MVIEFDWREKQSPEWDSSGTVAWSWTDKQDGYTLRIDEFTAESDGGFAYSIYEENGSPVVDNASADSFEDAEEGILKFLNSAPDGPDHTYFCPGCQRHSESSALCDDCQRDEAAIVAYRDP